jgi:23S rRNA pseudouridine2605 synthase
LFLEDIIRIAKYIASCGISSRRQAEALIAEHKVKVNGEIITSPALNITENDQVEIEDRLISPVGETKLYLYHKPAGLIVSHNDEQGRKTIFSQIPSFYGHLVTVGRLDMNSEGLLLLTSNGELARFMELPQNKWPRKYKVKIFGNLPKNLRPELARGIIVEGIKYQPIEVNILYSSGNNHWLELTLQEGKNREIRNICTHYNLKIARLIRTEFGPFSLGELPSGKIVAVASKMTKQLLVEMGNKKAT